MAGKAKTKTSASVEGDPIEQIRNLARKSFGEARTLPVKHWLPTGCTLLDLGVAAGWPGGRVVEIIGDEYTGKTALALHACRSAQLQGGLAIFLDIETNLSATLAHHICGVSDNQDQWIYECPETAEDALQFAEEALAAIQSSNTVRPVVMVIDSIAMLMPKSERDKAYDEVSKVGELARLLGRFMCRSKSYLANSNSYIILINQKRASIGHVGHAVPRPGQLTPGGKAVRYQAAVRVHLRKTAEEKDTYGNVYGLKIEADIYKNKVGKPRKVDYCYYLRDDQPVLGIDDMGSCIDYLIRRKIATKAGSRWGILDVVDYRDRLRDRAIEDAEWGAQLRDLTRKAFREEHGELSE